MKIEKLHIETLTEIISTYGYSYQQFVIFGGFVYFINPYKLDKILSLMELLYDFNDFTNATFKQNITFWLKNKNLGSRELLEEICYYKVKNSYLNEHSEILRFFIFENSHVNKFDFNLYFSSELRAILKNAAIFDFLSKFNDEFNKYVNDIFQFFYNNPSYFSANINFFSDYLLEIDKYKLKNDFKLIDNLKITCITDENFEDNIKIKKTHIDGIFQECVKTGTKFDFEIFENSKIKGFNFLKYIQLLEFLNKKRFSLSKTPLKYNSNIITDEKEKITSSNFSILDTNQILFLSLNNENKKLLQENISLQKIFFNNYNNPRVARNSFDNFSLPSENLNCAKLTLYDDF